MAKKSNKPITPEELGAMIKNIYESGYLDRNTAYRMSFIKGVLAGLGGVIGATIVVALLLWVLSLLHDVRFVGRFVDNIQDTVQPQSR